jgi:acetoin utilization deacetylase AcuC-like enzyme
MINDFAVAIRTLQSRGRIRRAMTVDCDVHQGNGTAFIFGAARPRRDGLPSSSAPVGSRRSGPGVNEGPAKEVFTISLHQENNYPYFKPPSTIDVSLRDGCSDPEYLCWLNTALNNGLEQFDPELICYIAGADPYAEDQLGGLDLSIEGLKQRDELVFRVARARNIPIMVTYAGGYAHCVEDTVTIHCNTVVAAAEIYKAVHRA